MEMRRELQTVLSSGIFARSPRQAKFLKYVCEKVFLGEPDQIKEYTIAVDVLGRPQDFDHNEDATVRVEAHRLRKKLAKYYESEGADHPIRIFIETGQYVPQFIDSHQIPEAPDLPFSATRSESRIPDKTNGNHLPEALDEAIIGRPSSWARFKRPAVLAGVAVLFLVSGAVIGRKANVGTPTVGKPVPSDPAIAFWTSFLGNDKEPVIAFSDLMFLNTSFGDLLKLRGGGATADRGAAMSPEATKHNLANPALLDNVGPLFYEDGYTGTGEAYGSFRIATLLTRMGVNATAKRSRIASIYDLRSHSAIFLGAIYQNPALAEVTQPDYFVIETPQAPPYLWKGRIHNKHPVASEAEFYQIERDPTTQVMKADYAIFSVLPGTVPNRKIMVLSGLTTSGTQGAADFACSPAAMSSLQKKLGSGGAFPAYFQCVLRVETSKGLDAVQVRLVAGRVVKHEEP
jgi:hypothetical protein